MKVLVVHPGGLYSVSDVYDGLVSGLRAVGVQVAEARLDHGLLFFGVALGALPEGFRRPAWAESPAALAAARIIAQAATGGPDLVIAVSGLNMHPSVPAALREMGIPTALLCTETPYDPREPQVATLYDHVLTHERAGLALFAGHPSVHFLPHAFNPERHRPGPVEPDKQARLYFVGAGFDERRALFAPLAAEYGDAFVRQGVLWENEGSDINYEQDVIARITPNDEAARWYRSASINLNHHRTTAMYGSGQHITTPVQSLGPRAFEIAACRGFQLCDDSRSDLPALFGDSVPTYRAGDADDLLCQARHWLARPDARAALAQAAHEAVQSHSWHVRASQLLERIA